MVAGLIHYTRLAAHLESEYGWLRQMYEDLEPSIDERMIRTRLLTAFALEMIGGCPREALAEHVVDGKSDRGIDGFYFDRVKRRGFIIQAKHTDGPQATPVDERDAKSFTAGVSEIFSMTITENGNKKIQNISDEINDAITLTDVELIPILITTTDKPIPQASQTIFENGFRNSFGDAEALVHKNLTDLYGLISPFGTGAGVKINLKLNGYGTLSKPYNGYYGWITGSTLADAFHKHGLKLFTKNLRTGLGNTDINSDMYETALNNPEHFWYFNNGVTFTASGVGRSLKGGAAADDVDLQIDGASIVNGAQTTSTLARLLDAPGGEDALARVKCLVRVLEVPDDAEEFSADITRFNNSQNGIGVKDFVSLDPFQVELRRNLDAEFGVTYIIRSGEDAGAKGEMTITLQEATIALVVCGSSLDNAVRSKDKISTLWRDIEADPYTTIFDRSSVTPLALYKAVLASRRVEEYLKARLATAKKQADEGAERAAAVASHGNRLFAYYVLSGINIWRSKQTISQFKSKIDGFDLEHHFDSFVDVVFDQFSGAYKQPLFKNRVKCGDILKQLPAVSIPV